MDTSFITKFEYGEMLYENPRGIGCIKCHKSARKSYILSSYVDKKNIKHDIRIPALNKISFVKFKKVLTAKKNSSLIMPTYFLTNDELKSIYFYIINKK